MSAKLSLSKTTSIGAKKKQGGLDCSLWLFNLEDATYTVDADGVTVTSIAFATGTNVFRVDSEKFASSFSHSFEKPSLNSFFPQTLNIVTLVDTAQDTLWLAEVLRASKLGAIVLDNNRQFKLLGALNGLQGGSGDGFDSGSEIGAEQITTIMLEGGENDVPFRFVDAGGYDATLTAVEGYETPAV